MPAAAIPAIITAAGSVGAGALGYMSAKKASQPSPGEAAATKTQTDASDALSSQGRMLTGYGMPKLQQAGGYFSTLAGGNRAATTQLLAPETEAINALYGGTQRTLQRFLRGADRDSHLAELSRERVGKLGSLFSGARARGVEGLVNLGTYGVDRGTTALTGAAGIASDVAGRGMSNRYAGADLQRQAGADTAALIFQLLRSGAFKWGQSGGSTRLPGTEFPVTVPSGGR